MRFCRFGDGRLGLVEGSNVRDVTAALDVLPNYKYPLPPYDVFIANLDRVAERARSIASTSPSQPVAGMQFLSPVANPGKVIGAPNYDVLALAAQIAHELSRDFAGPSSKFPPAMNEPAAGRQVFQQLLLVQFSHHLARSDSPAGGSVARQ